MVCYCMKSVAPFVEAGREHVEDLVHETGRLLILQAPKFFVMDLTSKLRYYMPDS